jgi:hypothetical protein
MSARQIFDIKDMIGARESQDGENTTEVKTKTKETKAKKPKSLSALNPNKPFPCGFCDKHYVSAQSVLLHEMKYHDDQRRARDLMETLARHGAREYPAAAPAKQPDPVRQAKAEERKKVKEKEVAMRIMDAEPEPVIPTQAPIQAPIQAPKPAPVSSKQKEQPKQGAADRPAVLPPPPTVATPKTPRTVVASKGGKWF